MNYRLKIDLKRQCRWDKIIKLIQKNNFFKHFHLEIKMKRIILITGYKINLKRDIFHQMIDYN